MLITVLLLLALWFTITAYVCIAFRARQVWHLIVQHMAVLDHRDIGVIKDQIILKPFGYKLVVPWRVIQWYCADCGFGKSE